MSKRLLTFVFAAVAVSIAIAATASAAVVAGNTGWFWSNPLPQGNTLTLADTSGGRAYVAGEAGTLMRSDNGGAGWSGIRSGLPAELSDVHTLRAVTPDVVVFASDCGLRRTDDGGATVRRLPWTSNDASCPATITSLAFPTSSTGYVLLSSGDVIQTLDGGDSWLKRTAAPGTPAAGGGAIVSDIWFTSATSGVLTVGTKIYYTTDSGNSWTPVEDLGGQGGLRFEFTSATDGFAFGNKTSLFKTTDGGATWDPVAGDGKIEGTYVRSLSCATATTCLGATADGASTLRTDDGGTTWTTLKASTRQLFAVGFTSATHALSVGAGSAIVQTDDAGLNWAAVNSEAAGTFYYSHVDSANSALLFGGGTALARTTDAGTSWKPIQTLASGTIKDAAFPTDTRGYVLDSRNELRRTDNAGISWKVLDIAGATPNAIYASNDKTLLLIGGKGIRRSEDGGVSFATIGKSKFRKTRFTTVDRAGSAVVAYASKYAAMSKDDGKTWTTVKRSKKIKSVNSLDFVDAKNGWLTDSYGELWVTHSGGKKWTRNLTNGINAIRSIALADATHGYVADGSGSIAATTDGGKTWSQQSPFLSKTPITTTVAALSAKGAILFVPGTNRILATQTFGQIGAPSSLKIKSSKLKVKKNKAFTVSGTLNPSQGGEQMTVLAREANAKPGTKWKKQTVTVGLGGTFTTTWKIKKATLFVARWAGDATHDGSGAKAITVKLKK
jgi:photosystem II stability/assembly factor-like uncharacterized protein